MLRINPKYALAGAVVLPLLLFASLLLHSSARDTISRHASATVSSLSRKHAEALSSYNCDSLLREGRYLDAAALAPKHWQPSGCVLKKYTDLDEVSSCLQPGDEVWFLGDSTVRQVYWGFVNTFDRTVFEDLNVHGNHQVVRRGITLRLLWDPYLNNTGAFDLVQKVAKEGAGVSTQNPDPKYRPKIYLYATTGLWHSLFEPRNQVVSGFQRSFDRFLKVMADRVNGSFEQVYYSPTLLPYYPILDASRRGQITPEFVAKLWRYTDKAFGYERDAQGFGRASDSRTGLGGGATYRTNTVDVAVHYVPVFNSIAGETHLGLYDKMGIHYINDAIFLQKDILLNHFCNARAFANATQLARHNLPHTATCCVPYENAHARAVLAYVFTALALFALVVALHALAQLYAARGAPTATTLDALPLLRSARLLLGVLAGVTVAAVYCYYADRTHHVNKIARRFSVFEFATLLQLWLLVALFSSGWSTVPGLTEEDEEEDGGTTPAGCLSLPLLRECKGFCVALLLIINLTGADRLPTTFSGELGAQLLQTLWLCAELCEFVSLCHARMRAPEQDNRLGSFLVFRGARAVALPVLLTCALDSPRPFLAYGQYAVAARLTFWLALAAAAVVLLPATPEFDDSVLRALTRGEGSPALRHALRAARLLVAGTLVYGLLALEAPATASPVARLRRTLAEQLLPDFWVLLCTLLYSWHTHARPHNSHHRLLSPGFGWAWRHAAAAAALCAAGSYALLRFRGYYVPPASIVPLSTVQMHPLAEAAAEWGRGYTPLHHFVLSASLAAAYLVLRLAVLSASSSKTANGVLYAYLRAPVCVAGVGYEALLLRAHVLLAGDLTTRLHPLPTGASVPALARHTLSYLLHAGAATTPVPLPGSTSAEVTRAAAGEAVRKVVNAVVVGLAFAGAVYVAAGGAARWAALLGGGDAVGRVGDASNGFVVRGKVSDGGSEDVEMEMVEKRSEDGRLSEESGSGSSGSASSASSSSSKQPGDGECLKDPADPTISETKLENMHIEF